MRFTVAAILLFAMAACGSPDRRATADRVDLLAANLDPSVSAGTDFYQYAVGAWLKRNPIPADESSWSLGSLVYEELYAIKRRLSEEAAAANAPAGSDSQKVGDFWAAAMDAAKADAEGVAPLRDPLASIDAIQTPADAVRVGTELQRIGVGAFWSLWIGQDSKQSDLISITLWQGGLGLPDRDYYFNAEPGVAHARDEFPKHVGRMLKMIGRDEAAGAAVLKFEALLAKASRPLEDLRDPYGNYHKMPVEVATRNHTPHIDWRSILESCGLKKPDTVIVGQPEFLAAVDAALQTTPVNDLKDYLRFHLLRQYAPYLGTEFDREHFAFYGRELQGAKEMRPRWKRVLDAQEQAMGMVVGKLFVKEYFPEPVKRRYSDLVEAIRDTYREHIEKLEWMSDATKQKALEKLAKMTKKVVYPDVWKDCSALTAARDSYAANMMRAFRWAFDEEVKKFGRPVDRTQWEMTPQQWNAYYNPSNNEIVLPGAAFLIPGLRDADADDALVYGYAGASTIGHEITHGFDDEGRKFDAAGNLSDWWTPQDAAKFTERAEVMVKQFDDYEPIPGLRINGKATLGENIADFGGVVLALDAFKKTEQYRKGERIGGMTPLQRFFLGYAFGWMGHQREERLRRQLLSDVHSPAKWRVIGPFVNVPEFYEAFGIRKGDPMWRGEDVRARIW